MYVHDLTRFSSIFAFPQEDLLQAIEFHKAVYFSVDHKQDTAQMLGEIGEIFKKRGLNVTKEKGVIKVRQWIEKWGYPLIYERKMNKCGRCRELGKECWVGESHKRDDDECYECWKEVEKIKCAYLS